MFSVNRQRKAANARYKKQLATINEYNRVAGMITYNNQRTF